MSFKIGDKVEHKKYGKGIIVEDKTKSCNKNEVILKLDNGFPYLKQSAIAGYPGIHSSEESMYVFEDIVQIKDLKHIS